MTTGKASVQQELQQAWDDLRSLVDGIAEGEMLAPGVVEEWSVKDLLGHVAFWNHLAARNLRALIAGRPQDVEAPTGEQEVAAMNRRESERREGQTLARAREEWLASFEMARDALDDVAAETLDQQVGGWAVHARFAVDTHLHYREHAAQIRAWQRRLETSEV